MKVKFINSIRGIAILMVILVHVSTRVGRLDSLTEIICSYGQMGVQLFFVVSAYTLCLSASNRLGERKPLFSYIIRRFFRIAPLYYLAIFFFFLLKTMVIWFKTGIVHTPENYTLVNVLSNIFFLHGLYPPANNSIVPGGWSIGTEVAFYILFPVLFFYTTKIESLKNILFIVILIFLFSILTTSLITFFTGYIVSNNNFLYYNLINQFPVFCVGVAYYIYSKYNKNEISFKYDILIFLSLTIVNIYLWSLNFSKAFTLIPFISSVSFCFLINIFKKVKKINISFLNKIGEVSYSMYIIHFIFPMVILPVFYPLCSKYLNDYILLILFFIVSVYCTYLLALISEFYIERPFVNLGKNINSKVLVGNTQKDL